MNSLKVDIIDSTPDKIYYNLSFSCDRNNIDSNQVLMSALAEIIDMLKAKIIEDSDLF